jgi:iron complex outermembrane receptor protein
MTFSARIARIRRASMGGVWAALPVILLSPSSAHAQSADQPAAVPGQPVSTPASAPASPAAPTTNAPNAFGDIVVTAQKRAQSVNSVGMSITALGSDTLQQKNISDVADLVKLVPGFTFSQANRGSPVYSIRGVGFNEETLAASPAVSVYTDEIGYSFPIMTKGADLDLERVEVLKGPQGTLFGQNSTGGAINYIAAKPTKDFHAGFEMGFARFNEATVNGYISGPISDTLTARVAVATDQGGAWQKSYTRDERGAAKDNFKGRLIVDWNPTDRFSAVLTLAGWIDHSQPDSPALYKVTVQRPASQTPQVLAQPIAPETPGTADWTPGFPKLDEDFYQASLRANYTLTDQFSLTAISSYEHYRANDRQDADGSALTVFNAYQKGNINSVAEEVRLNAHLLDDKLVGMVGGNYTHDSTRENVTVALIDSSSSGSFTRFGAPLFDLSSSQNTQRVTTKAAFGNLEAKLTPTLSANVGVRYTDNNTVFDGCTADVDGTLAAGFTALERALKATHPGTGPVQVIPQGGCVTLDSNFNPSLTTIGLHQHNVSWRAGLNWKPLSRTLIYATVSKGYKSGNIPNVNATTVQQYQPVTQESLLAYEIGFKTNLGLPNVELTGAAFYYDYRNKQLRGRTIDTTGTFGALESLVNIPKSRVTGGELNLSAQPYRGLTFNFGGTILASRVTSHFNNYDAFGNPADFYGEAFPFTPKYSGLASVNYEWGAGKLRPFLGADVTARSSTNSAFGGSPLLYIKAYALIDLQAGFSADNGSLRVTVWGENIANKYYWTDTFRQIDNLSRHVGKPATYGIKLSKQF